MGEDAEITDLRDPVNTCGSTNVEKADRCAAWFSSWGV